MADREDDYPAEHDRYLEELDRKASRPPLDAPDRSYEGSRSKSRDRSDVPGSGRDRGEPERYRERERTDRDEPRRSAPERERYDRRDDDRRRDRYDDRFERGGSGGRRDRDFDRDRRTRSRSSDRRPARSPDRRPARSPERRRSRSPRSPRPRSPRERYDSRRERDDRDWDDRGGGGGRRGRGGGAGGGGAGGGRGRRDEYSDDDGYGGYKPRKRQIPPDPAKFEKPLPPGAGPSSIADPYHYLRQNVPTDPAQAQRLWLEQQLRSRQMVLQQQAVSAAAASAKTQRELYIGNLVPGAVTDVALRQLFNTTLAAAFAVAPGSEPVVNVNLHSDGRYAFVEFRTPEMATAALALNAQVQLLGQTISVGRPSGYVDPSKAAQAAQAAGLAVTAFQAGDMAGFAANAAAAGMNLAQLGLADLLPPTAAVPDVVGGGADILASIAAAAAAATAAPAAVTGPTAAAAGATAQELEAMAAALGQETAGTATAAVAAANGGEHGQAAGGEAPQQPQEAGQAAGAEAGQEATLYFSVEGMLSAEMLQDDEEYESVLEDLKDECDRHAPGGVVAVRVPRPPEGERAEAAALIGRGNYGKAFVSFRDTLAAQRAHAAIHGRLFAGSTVLVRYVSEEEFQAA